MTIRAYRSATHPDFVAHEIEPALVAAGLPISLAIPVAKMMDLGFGMDWVIDSLNRIVR